MNTNLHGAAKPVTSLYAERLDGKRLAGAEVGTSTGIGTGEATTAAIIAVITPTTLSDYAAKVCVDYSVTIGETTYDDCFFFHRKMNLT